MFYSIVSICISIYVYHANVPQKVEMNHTALLTAEHDSDHTLQELLMIGCMYIMLM